MQQAAFSRGGGRSKLGALYCAGLFALPGMAWAQDDPEFSESKGEVVITAKRPAGSVLGEIEPIGVLDADAIAAMGAPSIPELLKRLKPLTTSSSGGEPVFLLNGRRVAGYNEIGTLPPEAIERMEILPESEATRFGFPPTVRVLNFITKKRFRALMVQQLAGTTTEGGGETNYVEATATNIAGPRRTSLNVSYFRHNPVFQSGRDIVPDPDILFSEGGNVTGIGGASLDPALDALAGRPIAAAAVPAGAARQALAGYAASTPLVSDIGRTRTLVPRKDTVKLDGTFATPIGKTLNGALNLTMEADRTSGLSGLAPATLRVPGDSELLPFSEDVLLYRYLPDALLRQRSTSLNLHAAGTLQGSVARWMWNLTTSYDRNRGTARSEQGVPGLQERLDAGLDPFAPLPPEIAAQRLLARSRTLTRTALAKLTANGPALRLPAGDALVTLSGDYARSTSDARQLGVAEPPPELERTTRGGSVAVELPVASRDKAVLGFLGRLSVNFMLGVSDVSGFGRLVSSSYGLSWAPLAPLQFTATVNDARTAPEITTLTNPVLATPNVPFFDFTTGATVLVTSVSGGNPALAPERRRTTTLGVALKPWKSREFRVTADYVDTRITDQTGYLAGLTPDLLDAFPDRFERDASGTLVRADLRPVNLAEEREQKLKLGINLWTQLGPKPAPVAPATGAKPGDGPPPPPPKPRPSIWALVTTNWRFSDEIRLQPGSAPLDLLDGATLTGTGGRPRWDAEFNLGGSYDALNGGLYARIEGPNRVRSTLAESDLRFSGRTSITAYAMLDAGKLVKAPWAQKLTLGFTVENLLNDRVNVRDRDGRIPNRFQPGYLDPLGRSVRLGVRKLF